MDELNDDTIFITTSEDGFEVYYPNSNVPDVYLSVDDMLRHVRAKLQSMKFKDDNIAGGV